MIDYQPLYDILAKTSLRNWVEEFRDINRHRLSPDGHGDFQRWNHSLQQLPTLNTTEIELNQDRVAVRNQNELAASQRDELRRLLLALSPWRKGPYEIHGIHIDSEWRSDFKWQRLKDHITPLKNRRVLDVGCNNGYHCWRMYGEGARLVLGIDPSVLAVLQFHCIKHFIGAAPVFVAPLRMEQFCAQSKFFDSVFSMGILYHRKAPLDHLMELKNSLRSGGELILETLVINGDQHTVMVPEGRYAKMKNVYFLPSALALESWLKRCGFVNIKTISINQTNLLEQRATPWMQFESLANFLAVDNPNLTVEGLPAPTRAVVVAEAP